MHDDNVHFVAVQAVAVLLTFDIDSWFAVFVVHLVGGIVCLLLFSNKSV
jgi:hypothetical protein